MYVLFMSQSLCVSVVCHSTLKYEHSVYISTGAEVKGAGEATPTCSPVKDASKQSQTTGECGHCTVVYVTLSEHVGD